MELEHEFTVPVPVEQAWPVLLDIERVAPCMPGATLDTVEGDDFTGKLKVKVGPVTVTYQGKAGFTYKDEDSHAATIGASAKEARGSGTASATVRAQLHGEGDSTRVTVHTELQVTGRPAQFGRSMMSEVGAKLIGKFADCLAGELAGSPKEAAPAGETQAAETQGEPASGATSGGTTSAGTGGGAAAASTSAAPSGPPLGAQPAAATSPDGSGQQPSVNGSTGSVTSGEPGRRSGAHPQPHPHSSARSQPAGDAVNLIEVAGGPLVKRALPVAGGVLVILGIACAIRHKRHHSRRGLAE